MEKHIAYVDRMIDKMIDTMSESEIREWAEYDGREFVGLAIKQQAKRYVEMFDEQE